jgi:hypothetical protein
MVPPVSAHFSRMLPSVRGLIPPVEPGHLSSQRSEQIIAPPCDEIADPMEQRKSRVSDLAVEIRAVDGQQHDGAQTYRKPTHAPF